MGTAGDDFEGAYFFGGSVGFFSQVTRRPPKAKSHFGSVYGARLGIGRGDTGSPISHTFARVFRHETSTKTANTGGEAKKQTRCNVFMLSLHKNKM